MRRAIIASAFAALGAFGAAAADPAMTVIRDPLDGEHLKVMLPSSFSIANQQAQNGQTLTEFVRPGETLEQWTAMLTAVSFIPASPDAVPRFVQVVEDGLNGACAHLEKSEFAVPVVDGLTLTGATYLCEMKPEMVRQAPWRKRFELIHSVVIQGRSTIYNLQVGWHTNDEAQWPPANAVGDDVLVFLRQFAVCQAEGRDCVGPLAHAGD